MLIAIEHEENTRFAYPCHQSGGRQRKGEIIIPLIYLYSSGHNTHFETFWTQEYVYNIVDIVYEYIFLRFRQLTLIVNVFYRFDFHLSYL